MSAFLSRLDWARDLVAILDALPDREATALRLVYFEHLTEPEVATRMGIDPTAARTATARGLLHLGELLQVVPAR